MIEPIETNYIWIFIIFITVIYELKLFRIRYEKKIKHFIVFTENKYKVLQVSCVTNKNFDMNFFENVDFDNTKNSTNAEIIYWMKYAKIGDIFVLKNFFIVRLKNRNDI